MESFEELGLKPELVEALAAEGIEVPTAIQHDAIPLLRKGHSAAVRAGPGAGVLLAYGAPLLDRIPVGEGRPGALVLTATRPGAIEAARRLGRLALATGHRVAALGGDWALPELADILFATPEDLVSMVEAGDLMLHGVSSLVLDGAGMILKGERGERTEELIPLLDGEALQGIVVGEPLTKEARQFIERHFSRTVFVPSEAAAGDGEESPVERGSLKVLTVEGRGATQAFVSAVSDVLDEGARHVIAFFRNEDRAADFADHLLVHGYASGVVGDLDVPVWLSVNPAEARRLVDESIADPEDVAVVSADVPSDTDTLDRRHSMAPRWGTVVAYAREVPHLRRTAAEAGYKLQEVPAQPVSTLDGAQAFRRSVEEVLEAEDLAGYVSLLEPLLEHWSGIEVAAALTALLRRKGAVAGAPPTSAVGSGTPGGPAVDTRPPSWSKLFLTVGERDGARAGDILGAITGETDVQGGQVGRIEIRDTYTRVEVEAVVAEKVIQGLNGITIRGRSVRADFDRNDPRSGGGGRQSGSRGGPSRDR